MPLWHDKRWKNMEKTQRDSKFEILRIICMLMIVAHHLSCHGGFIFDSISAVNRGFIDALIVGGKIGVNVFVLISGYFLCCSKFKLSKLIKLLFEIFFYSFFIYIIFVATGRVQFSVKDFFYSMFPTSSNAYWFMTCYVIMYILSPFINKMINSLTKKEHLLLIGFLLLLQTIFPMIGFSYLSNVAWFITLYIIAGFLRLHPSKYTETKWISIVLFCVSFVAIITFNAFLKISLWGATGIVCLICSIAMFNMFKNIKKPIHSSFINIVSSATLGVYLLHDNNYIRSWLWQTFLKCPQMAEQWFYPLFALGAILGVFAVCVLIDLFRIYAIERPFFKVSNKIVFKIKTKIANKKRIVEETNMFDAENKVDDAPQNNSSNED